MPKIISLSAQKILVFISGENVEDLQDNMELKIYF